VTAESAREQDNREGEARDAKTEGGKGSNPFNVLQTRLNWKYDTLLPVLPSLFLVGTF